MGFVQRRRGFLVRVASVILDWRFDMDRRRLTLVLSLATVLALTACSSQRDASEHPAVVSQAVSTVPTPVGVGAFGTPVNVGMPVAAFCDPGRQTGASGPLAVCSPSLPCNGDASITSAIDVPQCPAGTSLLAWKDSVVDPSNGDPGDGRDQRYACVPDAAPASAVPVPIVLWFPPSYAPAPNVYSGTQLGPLSATYAWADGARGFLLLALQSRNIQIAGLSGGAHEDVLYHPDDPALNPDVRNADALVDWAVQRYGGAVDPSRIYATGWSNGAIFAMYYAMARHASTWLDVAGSAWGTPTPGGHFVSGAAVYSGVLPFGALPSGDCGMQTLPWSEVPLRIVHRDCDLVACDEGQQECGVGFRGMAFAPGATNSSFNVRATLDELAAMGDFHVEDVILDFWGIQVPWCQPTAGGFNGWGVCNAYSGDAAPFFIPTPAGGIGAAQVYWTPGISGGCTPIAGVVNHLLYPSGRDGDALAFLGQYASAP
jgi:hypothetical protein